MVDVDVLLRDCPLIAATAESVAKLSSLCDTIASLSALSFLATSPAARHALLHGGRGDLVPPRSLDADVDDDAAGLVPQREPPPIMTVRALLKAVLYHMRHETGEEWCRSSGGDTPPLVRDGFGALAVPHVDIATRSAADAVDRKCCISTS
jgi:hypothetical protein